MPREAHTYLADVRMAAGHIITFTTDRDLGGYRSDAMLRSAVERQLGIIGEALNQLTRVDPELAERIPDLRPIIGLRNVLAHGYAAIDDSIVWSAVQTRVPALFRAVEDLLRERSA